MSSNDDVVKEVLRKIEREKTLVNAAMAMRQQTNNEVVRARLDTQMREGRRNVEYLESRLHELQMRSVGQGVDNMNIGQGNSGAGRPQSAGMRNDRDGPPTPPPKNGSGGYLPDGQEAGGYGSHDYSQIGGHGDIMPPRHPYAPPAPGSGVPKPRPNFSKLGTFGGEDAKTRGYRAFTDTYFA